MRAALAAVAVALLSCAGSASDPQRAATADATRYARLVAAPDPDPAQALADCAGLSDPDLAGDCGLAVVLHARARGVGRLDALCPQVRDGPWRDECFFMLAEDALRARDLEGAAAACMRSGAFKHDCGQHLWQGDLRKLVRGQRAAPLEERAAAAQRIYDRWQPHLAETDIAWRFWQRFFERVAETQAGVNLDRCAPLDDPTLRTRCRYGAAHLYLRRVWDLLHDPMQREDLCALEPVTVAAAEARLPSLEARPDPLLQAVLDEAVAAACAGGSMHPAQDGVVSRAALEAALAARPTPPPAAP